MHPVEPFQVLIGIFLIGKKSWNFPSWQPYSCQLTNEVNGEEAQVMALDVNSSSWEGLRTQAGSFYFANTSRVSETRPSSSPASKISSLPCVSHCSSPLAGGKKGQGDVASQGGSRFKSGNPCCRAWRTHRSKISLKPTTYRTTEEPSSRRWLFRYETA